MIGTSRSTRSRPRSPAAPEAGAFVLDGPWPATGRRRKGAPYGALASLVFLLLAGSTLAGCDFFTVDSDPAAEARIKLEGEESGPLEMITSNAWEPGGTGEDGSQNIVLLDSDTAGVDVPFEGTYGLDGEDRFFVRVRNPDPDTAPSVTMQVFLDDEQFYDRTLTLEGDERHQFTYRLR